jgi:hypothetical protein
MQSAATSWNHLEIFSLIPRSLLHLCADIWPSQALLLLFFAISGVICVFYEHAPTQHIDGKARGVYGESAALCYTLTYLVGTA